MPSHKLVIFDWDGTLMDSVAHIVDSIQQAAIVMEQPIPSMAASRHIIGLGLPEAMAILFPQATKAQCDLIRQQYAQQFMLGAPEKVQLFAGVRQLLTELREQGVLLAVATGKSRAGLNRVLAQTGLGDYFIATRCADETVSKPHPLMLQELLAYTSIAIDDAVMVGDTSYDLEMAQRLAMPRIGVSYGVHSVEVLQSYQPLAIVDSAYQLQELLC